MTRRSLLRVVAALAFPLGGASAQHMAVSLAAGAVSVRFAEQDAFVATTLSPAFTLRAPRAALVASGTLSQVNQAGWSRQGNALGSLFTPMVGGGWVGELSASVGGSSYPDGLSTAQTLGGLRLHHIAAQSGLWVGGNLGRMYDGDAWRAVRQLDLGAQWRGEAIALSGIVTPSVTDDTLSYTDLLAVLATSVGPLDLTLSLGGRAGASLPIPGGDTRVWGGASLMAWVAPRAALTLGVGTYPVDVTQGFPAGEYVALGIRLGGERALRALEGEERRAVRRSARAAGVTEFVATRISSGMVEFRVRAPSAQLVEVTGDPTGWRPERLVKGQDGWWSGRFASSARLVELTLRVDGGPWVIPPGADVATDEFGGRVGRIALP